ncbi:hypothetical protein [Sandaracinobacteroides saxicola]|uniref:Uncharacterized protein n=1 Tax=Sandaracinobacteroides saxicola TaxID=2759707 RepID=A0A7G5IIG2_9SPHN|nr:hypothetical protein [Sandaracinobacteroides saxicola]QMW23154.1 hypothetical protein H3309_01180 [Sandaracinobacteroides saxicola]
MPSYIEFRHSQTGEKLITHLMDPRVIASVEQTSLAGRPAVAAIDEWASRELPPLTDTEKQHAGRLMRDVLAPRGWRVSRSNRVSGGRFFSSGAIYERQTHQSGAPIARSPLKSAAEQGDEVVARLAAVRTGNAGTVDDFLAERRREARAERDA